MTEIEQKAWVKGFSEQQLANVVYTKLKFMPSKTFDTLVGFVSRNHKTKMLCGVREDSPLKKKVCVLNKPLRGSILANTLYDCTLVPARQGNCYIVVEANVTQFNAHVSSQYVKGSTYFVQVEFGGSSIVFDPLHGKQESVKNLDACKEVLEKRVDIKNIGQVVKDFMEAGRMMLRLLNRDKYSLKKL